ncbi:hypothetical protein [Microcoleus sp. PH2017_05_CCC_O_A]|uniref:low molecular weight protein tyrosine phosphatase family protein n=1 Tax=Microcoleus sp. PH2017_05_CCC_O_A TaxID=2798816 RepID=UPI001D1C451D|nr:hypothetical protein [Microcoleus sp. PH2017_05_CCC_O_A]MCC3436609.1 hypothetical protein [Microcoleus sp. PH2017_05_CCC_O_A]
MLFWLSQNKWRSLTAEKICEKISGYSARSAGTEKGARIRVTEGLLGWADVIFVMEKKHGARLRSKFPDSLKGKKVICLQISDNYRYMEPELVEILQAKLGLYMEMPDNEINFMERVLEPELRLMLRLPRVRLLWGRFLETFWTRVRVRREFQSPSLNCGRNGN